MKVILFMLCLLAGTFPQSSKELRAKYGSPVNEAYLVRPGVLVTTTFAKSGEICEMIIEPQRPRTPIKSSVARLHRKEIDEIIDELIPVEKRGKPTGGGFINARCLPHDDCWGSSSSYEKVDIYYNVSGEDEYRYVTIQWKGKTCQR